MVNVVPYDAEHLFKIDVQEAQREQVIGYMTPETAALLEGYSMMDGDDCLGCAGIVDAGHGRGIAWMILGKHSGPHFIPIVRAIERMLDVSGYRRIEMACAVNFPESHRLALLLGFMPEGRMAQYFSQSRDAILYARMGGDQ